MAQAPTKDKEEKREKDSIFLEILYSLLVQLPIVVVTWIISKFDWD
jgi:hypothetical protein